MSVNSNSGAPSPDAGDTRRAARLKLLFLAALFIGPVAISTLLYFGSSWRPQGTVNKGHLLSPVKPIPKLALVQPDGTTAPQEVFSKTWTMLYVGSSNCDELCRKTLYNARQVHTALGKESHRVQGVFIATDTQSLTELQTLLDQEHKGLNLYIAAASVRTELLNFLASAGASPESPGRTYILDPLGNWVLYYTPDDPPKGMLKDLKKLLRLSSIG